MRNSLLFFLLFLSGIAMAQNKIVKGKVTSEEDGSALPGVSVVLKGSTAGTSTDENGSYSIEVPSSGSTLTFSYVGFLYKEVSVGAQSVIDVSLVSDIKSLSEVVVVGYVCNKRKLLPDLRLVLIPNNLVTWLRLLLISNWRVVQPGFRLQPVVVE